MADQLADDSAAWRRYALVVDGGVTPADVPHLAVVLGEDRAGPEGPHHEE